MIHDTHAIHQGSRPQECKMKRDSLSPDSDYGPRSSGHASTCRKLHAEGSRIDALSPRRQAHADVVRFLGGKLQDCNVRASGV